MEFTEYDEHNRPIITDPAQVQAGDILMDSDGDTMVARDWGADTGMQLYRSYANNDPVEVDVIARKGTVVLLARVAPGLVWDPAAMGVNTFVPVHRVSQEEVAEVKASLLRDLDKPFASDDPPLEYDDNTPEDAPGLRRMVEQARATAAAAAPHPTMRRHRVTMTDGEVIHLSEKEVRTILRHRRYDTLDAGDGPGALEGMSQDGS